jgi:hypothetical protein
VKYNEKHKVQRNCQASESITVYSHVSFMSGRPLIQQTGIEETISNIILQRKCLLQFLRQRGIKEVSELKCSRKQCKTVRELLKLSLFLVAVSLSKSSADLKHFEQH